MFTSCAKAAEIFCSSLDETGLIQGVTDVIVVKHKTGEYRGTRFFACVGPYAVNAGQEVLEVYVNKTLINQLKFKLDKYGYLYPNVLKSEQLQKLGLKLGKNTIEYKIQQFVLSAEIFLYTDNDKVVVSDVDGTLTKDDIGGLYNNYLDNSYIHDGYTELVTGIAQNGYKVVWMTMRSLPMYNFSKRYINNHVKVEGPLLMEPEEFFHAMKKEILKQAGNVKANIMNDIKKIFPSAINPFMGGLGNRETDAIAYLHAGISSNRIYIIDTSSQVHKLDNKDHQLTYQQLVKQIQKYFPKYTAIKIGYV